jgi:hypothetical protein
MMKDIQIQKFAFHNENKTGQFYPSDSPELTDPLKGKYTIFSTHGNKPVVIV